MIDEANQFIEQTKDINIKTNTTFKVLMVCYGNYAKHQRTEDTLCVSNV